MSDESPKACPPPLLLTVGDAARELASSRTTVYKLMDAGELPYVKIGRSRRVEMAEVRQLIERNRVGGRFANDEAGAKIP